MKKQKQMVMWKIEKNAFRNSKLLSMFWKMFGNDEMYTVFKCFKHCILYVCKHKHTKKPLSPFNKCETSYKLNP